MKTDIETEALGDMSAGITSMAFLAELCQKLDLESTPNIKAEILRVAKKIDLLDTLNVGRYGAVESTNTDISHDHNEAVSSVSATVTGLVKALEKADPEIALKRQKKSFIARFIGSDVVQQVEYVRSTEGIDSQLDEVPARVQRLELIVHELDKDYRDLLDVQKHLKVHLAAGQLHLEENPGAGIEGANNYGLSSPRDRFIKRMQNLAVLLASNSTTLHQIQLLQANSINMLDRLHEITTVLIPSWRSHRLGLYVNDQDYAAIQEATHAHETLIESLRAL